jgi:carbonic anhydrase
MNGNTRYIKKQFRADGRGPKDRQRLLGGQKPHAIVLSCADSRVPPEIVFDQELGEIFVIRVAGEALDSSVIASIEYAVEHLDPHLLIVMGHTQCGAIDATLKTKEGSSAGSEALDKLLADIRPRLKSIPEGKGSANLEIESTVNADGVARDLLKRSEIIKKRVDSGDLVIKPALYRMDSGKVSFY